jgi:hypothetical protein
LVLGSHSIFAVSDVISHAAPITVERGQRDQVSLAHSFFAPGSGQIAYAIRLLGWAEVGNLSDFDQRWLLIFRSDHDPSVFRKQVDLDRQLLPLAKKLLWKNLVKTMRAQGTSVAPARISSLVSQTRTL